VADCQCNLGYFRIANADPATSATVPYHCRACPLGQHKNKLESWVCADCEKGTYTDSTGNEDCTDCPANSHTLATRSNDVINCVCNAGYEFFGPACQQCVKGKFRPDPFDPANAGTHNCLSAGVYNRANCAPCDNCALGFYQDETGQAQCKQCPQHATSSYLARNDVRACQCKDGYGVGDGEASLAATVSLPGYEFDDDTCTMCATGKYSSEVEYDFNLDSNAVTFKQKVCIDCPEHMSTPEATPGDENADPVQAAVLHDEPGDCLCNPGYEPATFSEPGGYVTGCEKCPLGKYKPTLGNTDCLPCGILSQVTTPSEGTILFENCQCDASEGFFEAS